MNPLGHPHQRQYHRSESPPTPPSLPPSTSSSLSSLPSTATAAMSSEQPAVPAGASAGTPGASFSAQNQHARPPTTTTTSSTTTRGQPISATFSLAPMTTTTVVTTTTTTSTEYPPLVFKAPPIPSNLDPRLFPLADTPTPHALKKFCFDLNGQPTFFHENQEGEQAMGQLEDALCNLSASAHQNAVRAFTDEKLRQRSLFHHHQHAQDQHQLPLGEQHSHHRPQPSLNEEHTTTRTVSAGKGNGKSIVTTTTRKTVIAPRTILHPPGTTLLYGARKRPASPNTPVNSTSVSASTASNTASHNMAGSSASASSSSSAHAILVHDRLLNKDQASPPHKKTKVPDRNEPTHPTALQPSSSSSSSAPSTSRLAPSASAPSVSAFVTPSAPHRPRLHTSSHIGGSATAADGTTTPASAMSAISSTSSFVDSTNLPSPSLSPTTAHQAGIGSSSSITATAPQAGESSTAGSIRRFTASHPASMYRDAENDAMENDIEQGYPFGTMLDHHHHHLHHRYRGNDTHLVQKDDLEEEEGEHVDEDVDDVIKSAEARLEDALDEERDVGEEGPQSSAKALTKAGQPPSLMDLPALVQTYDALPASLQSYMLFQLLRRSPAPTLQFVSSVILNTMKYDFLALLPVELRLNILKYLDAPSLCAAAQVSKTWRIAVDSDAHIWMNRIQKDGFILYDNEEKEAQSQQLGIDGHYGPRLSYQTRMEMVKRRQAKGKGRFQYPVTRPTDLPESPLYPGDVTMKGDDDNDDTEMIAHEGGAVGSSGAKSGWDSDTAGEEGEPMDETYAGVDAAPPSPTTSHTGRLNAEYDSEDEMMDQDIEPPFGPMEPSTPHSYKALYRRHWLIRQNWAKGRAEYIKFPGHSDRVVTCLEFDSEKIVSGSDDKTIHVYDTLTGKRLKKFSDHDGGVWALKYRGNTLVSGSTDRTVRVWDIAAGKCTHVFQGHTSTVRCLQIVEPKNMNKDPRGPPKWEPEFPVIVTGSRDSTLRVWRLPDPELNGHIPRDDPSWLLHTLVGHNHSVRALAAEGSVLVSGSYDFSVRVWNLMTGKMVHRLQGHTSKVYSVVLDMERNQCMSGSMDARVRVWSLEDGSCLHELEGHSQLVGLLGLNAGHLVSAAADCTVRIWDPDRGVCLRILAAHAAAITCFQHDAYKVISGSDGNLKMWDFKTGKFIRNLLTGLSNVWQVKFDERRCVAAVQRDGATFIEVLDYGIFGIEKPLENAPTLPPGEGSSSADLGRLNRSTPNAAAVAGGVAAGGGAGAAAGAGAGAGAAAGAGGAGGAVPANA